MKANIKLTAVFEEAPEGGYTGYIEEIAGVNTQGESLDEVKNNLLEALELMMDTQRAISENELKNKKVIRENLQMV